MGVSESLWRERIFRIPFELGAVPLWAALVLSPRITLYQITFTPEATSVLLGLMAFLGGQVRLPVLFYYNKYQIRAGII